jgi:hypothetical protein
MALFSNRWQRLIARGVEGSGFGLVGECEQHVVADLPQAVAALSRVHNLGLHPEPLLRFGQSDYLARSKTHNRIGGEHETP